MVLKAGKTGLSGPDDFEVNTGSDDDGERYAGGKVLKVMQNEGVIDAVVVVSRWYGGVMLGPVRFTHFETCAREVCRTFRLKDDITAALSTLTSLDDILASLRADLAALDDSSNAIGGIGQSQPKKSQDYTALEESLDVAKARRLIKARENAIKSVKAALRKGQEKQKGQD
ncbi:uncharacterized protein FIBRA_06078 [Fibroporia radiculosa]|uniref:Impact N-terminal domain-containing protein n=1 Tax=Fibroporia radiculosa TaxID=599839 RepID=J4IB26_9APHY|nr:uncharacterized protein FIBRA_06078 [Fibroporia radiculosa]CCM03926.1 predicted protein [Fibroporia radiculosa]